ncbi:MAG TPA: hypothetical protein VLB79_05870 [Solirubrobacterales bacterium]|nr:hypothetical protein [Solirubrobacterales bacterium]
MIPVVAHFTVAELPGTLAILVFGVVLGAAVAERRIDALTIGITAFCGLAAVGSVLDHFNDVPTAWKTAADGAFLFGGMVLLAVIVAGRSHGNEPQRLRGDR